MGNLKALLNLITKSTKSLPGPVKEIKIVSSTPVLNGSFESAVKNAVKDSKNYYKKEFVKRAAERGNPNQEELGNYIADNLEKVSIHKGFPEKDLIGRPLNKGQVNGMSDVARTSKGEALLDTSGEPIRAVYLPESTGKYSVMHELGGHNATLNYDALRPGWNTLNGFPSKYRKAVKDMILNAEKLTGQLVRKPEFANLKAIEETLIKKGYSPTEAAQKAKLLDKHIEEYLKRGTEGRARWFAGRLKILDKGYNEDINKLTDSEIANLESADNAFIFFTKDSMAKLYKGMYGLIPTALISTFIPTNKEGGKLIPKYGIGSKLIKGILKNIAKKPNVSTIVKEKLPAYLQNSFYRVSPDLGVPVLDTLTGDPATVVGELKATPYDYFLGKEIKRKLLDLGDYIKFELKTPLRNKQGIYINPSKEIDNIVSKPVTLILGNNRIAPDRYVLGYYTPETGETIAYVNTDKDYIDLNTILSTALHEKGLHGTEGLINAVSHGEVLKMYKKFSDSFKKSGFDTTGYSSNWNELRATLGELNRKFYLDAARLYKTTDLESLRPIVEKRVNNLKDKELEDLLKSVNAYGIDYANFLSLNKDHEYIKFLLNKAPMGLVASVIGGSAYLNSYLYGGKLISRKSINKLK